MNLLKLLAAIFNPFKKANEFLNPKDPSKVTADFEEVFGFHNPGNQNLWASQKTVDDFLTRVSGMINPKEISNGIPAEATVINANLEKMRLKSATADMHKMTMQLNISTQNGDTWQTTLEDMIPENQTALFQPGYTFNVKYDPNNKMNVCINRQ